MHSCEPLSQWCTPRTFWGTRGCTVHTGWRALV